MDPLELRRKNFMDPASFPHETALGVVYDSGDYPKALDTLLEHIDPEAVKAEAPAGKHRGVGFSTYTEICGLAPFSGFHWCGYGLAPAAEQLLVNAGVVLSARAEDAGVPQGHVVVVARGGRGGGVTGWAGRGVS